MNGTVFPSSSSSNVRATLSTGRPRSRATCPKSIEVVVVMQSSNLPTWIRAAREGASRQRANLTQCPTLSRVYDDSRCLHKRPIALGFLTMQQLNTRAVSIHVDSSKQPQLSLINLRRPELSRVEIRDRPLKPQFPRENLKRLCDPFSIWP